MQLLIQDRAVFVSWLESLGFYLKKDFQTLLEESGIQACKYGSWENVKMLLEHYHKRVLHEGEISQEFLSKYRPGKNVHALFGVYEEEREGYLLVWTGKGYWHQEEGYRHGLNAQNIKKIEFIVIE